MKARLTFGLPHLHLKSCESTNEIARGLALAGTGSGTLVTADRQSAGRGRQGRPWSTPDGALAYSLILRGAIEVPSTLPLRAGVAVSEAVESLGAKEAKLKWPNDVWIEGRKCAGILVEARPQDQWAVVGVGLNLAVDPTDFDPELRDRVTSVGTGSDRKEAIAAINSSLGHWLVAPAEQVLEELGSRDALKGREIAWQGGTGVAAGIGATGNLEVELADGRKASLDAGEVHLRA